MDQIIISPHFKSNSGEFILWPCDSGHIRRDFDVVCTEISKEYTPFESIDSKQLTIPLSKKKMAE